MNMRASYDLPYIKNKKVLRMSQPTPALAFFKKYNISSNDLIVQRFYQNLVDLSDSYVYNVDDNYMQIALNETVIDLGFNSTIPYNDCMNAIILSLPIIATNLVIYDLLTNYKYVSQCIEDYFTIEFEL